MNTTFSTIKKVVKTELIKKKRSAIFTLSVIYGAFFPIIIFISGILRDIPEQTENKIPINIYLEVLETELNGFIGFFFPVLMIFTASKIAQIDHKNRGWHFMEMQPVTKFSIYISKFIVLVISNLIAIMTLLLFTIIFIYPLGLIANEYYTTDIPIAEFLQIGFRLFVISLCISAFQYLVSVIIPNFVWSFIIGFSLFLLPLLLKLFININLNWYPFQMLKDISTYPRGSQVGSLVMFSEKLSIVYTLLFLIIGHKWYALKGFLNAFFKSKKGVFVTWVMMFVLGVFIWYFQSPKQQERHTRTIVSGQIDSDKNINEVYIFNQIIEDTIAKIKVENNKFHHVIKDKIITDTYTLQIGNFAREQVYFGDKDSLFIDYKFYGQEQEFKLFGTRLAENNQKSRKFWYKTKFIEQDLRNNRKIDDEQYYIDKINDAWKEQLSTLISSRTVDNFVPSDDYFNRDKKIITLNFLKLWDKFVKKREALYPNEPIQNIAKIERLKNSISLNEESLFTDRTYINYVLSQIIKDDKRDVSRSQKYFENIIKMQPNEFRDRLLYSQLKTSLKDADKNTTRDSLMEMYSPLIATKSYKELLYKKYKTYNRLSKGQPAPNFVAYDLNRKTYTLENFKGKIIVIDCWATWCAPCKRQEPYFVKKAIQYKDNPVQFMSLNFDVKQDDWEVDVRSKSKSVLHLRPKYREKFGENFQLKYFPRFIVIGKDGKIINVNFVPPSEKVFDELLQSYFKF